jgi:hypothetical protein
MRRQSSCQIRSKWSPCIDCQVMSCWLTRISWIATGNFLQRWRLAISNRVLRTIERAGDGAADGHCPRITFPSFPRNSRTFRGFIQPQRGDPRIFKYGVRDDSSRWKNRCMIYEQASDSCCR